MNVDDLLACPGCGESPLVRSATAYTCASCETDYVIRDGVPVFFRSDTTIIDEEGDRAEFWNAGWIKRNAHLLDLDRDGILNERQGYLNELSVEGYPSVADMSSDTVGGKTFLNIGCGGGYEGLLFSGYGTRYIGVDFSHNAALLTRQIVEKAGFDGTTFQAEAEALPFSNDSIDYIYSSGVLHHTPNTNQTLREVYRVLKPGGTAMIGLYATYSTMFLWYRLHAILRGNFSKAAIDDWMNANTEGDWQVENNKNRWTKTYTKSQFRTMMQGAGFADCTLQQTPQQIKSIPIVGKIVTAILPTAIGDLRVGPFGSMLVVTCIKT